MIRTSPPREYVNGQFVIIIPPEKRCEITLKKKVPVALQQIQVKAMRLICSIMFLANTRQFELVHAFTH